MNNTKYEFDGTSLYNRASVTGVTTTIHPKKKAAPTDTFVAGASQFAFNLSNIPDPASTNPIVTVNNTKQSCLYSDGTGTQTTAFGPPQWLVQQQANGSWALRVNFPDASPPSGGSIINIWYPYQTSVTAQADDTQSQIAIGGPNKGIFAKGINARTLSDTSAAQQRAKREVKEYGRPQERITFTTTEEWVGLWQAGQSFTLKSSMLLDSQNNFTAPLNATFVITQASPNFTQDGFRTWNITGVRVQ